MNQAKIERLSDIVWRRWHEGAPARAGILHRQGSEIARTRIFRRRMSLDSAAKMRSSSLSPRFPAPAVAAPDLELHFDGGRVIIRWLKNQFDAIEIEVDRDGRGFVRLTIDAEPDSIDPQPLPAEPGTWKYRAIYLLRDARYGQWSKTAQTPVTALQ